jgi:hypothetical protein
MWLNLRYMIQPQEDHSVEADALSQILEDDPLISDGENEARIHVSVEVLPADGHGLLILLGHCQAVHDLASGLAH